MRDFMLRPTATALWQALVSEAEERSQCRLNEEQESYLVFLLIRFLKHASLGGQPVALDYLTSQTLSGQMRSERLRDVGDQCLLLSGLFPRRAERRRVKTSYFVQLGRSAYNQLSESALNGMGSLYQGLAEGFVDLMDVLHAIRRLDHASPWLEPLEAMELWQDTGSRLARRSLQAVTGATPQQGPPRRGH